MTAGRRLIFLAGLLFILLPRTMTALQTLQGQVSSGSSGTDFYSVYANSDPLGGKPEETPTTIGSNSNKCVAPNSAWQLVAQRGNTCYWYAPLTPPIKGYVVPMSKMSWVEATGGTCGENPFSDPNDPNGTAVCDQPAPQDNPYAPPPPVDPGLPPTDFYTEHPSDPARLLVDYKDVIAKASRGDPRTLSIQLGPRLQQDMTSCSKYAAHGMLSSGCCTSLGQAANFNMEGTAPARQQSKMFLQSATNVCHPQTPGGDSPHFYTLSDKPDPKKIQEVLTADTNCKQWSPTQVICQGPLPPQFHAQMPKLDKRNPKTVPGPFAPPLQGKVDTSGRPLEGGTQEKVPKTDEPPRYQDPKNLGSFFASVINKNTGESHRECVNISSNTVGPHVGQISLTEGEAYHYFTNYKGTMAKNGTYTITELTGSDGQTYKDLHYRVDFTHACK